jgi:hypothetical protein
VPRPEILAVTEGASKGVTTMTPRWSVTWSAFWPGLAASTGSGVWWQPHGETSGQPQQRAGEVTSRDRVLALARHPSFTSAVAARVVHELGWEELVDVWDESGRLLFMPANLRHLVGYVRVRAAVLDELEGRNPRKFHRWYARQWESLDQGRRTGR